MLGAQKSSIGRRDVFGADFGRKVCLVRLPVSRVRLSCRPRTDKFLGSPIAYL